jgi:pimeloyl-ACP methyl ester carboxylesterase
MDMDPSHGVGRALFTALDEFASLSAHPELSSAKLIVLGFSGTGALFAHFVGYAPDRVVAAILADPGHYDPVGVDNVRLSSEAVFVPELILAGGADKVSGTQRPYNYFRFYRDRGAPWVFLVQNSTPHCCIINAKSLILAWLDQIIKLRQPSPTEPLRKIDDGRGWIGYMRKCPSEARDGWGASLWDVCDARIQQVRSAAPADMVPSGWLPSHRVAMEWLTLIKQPAHPINSLP